MWSRLQPYVTQALSIEELGPSRFVGRAATLQQLARVAERRGDRAAALGHLQDTLCSLYSLLC